jgi:TRAP-type C4-dicarboxylate transport system substrate-binding protein
VNVIFGRVTAATVRSLLWIEILALGLLAAGCKAPEDVTTWRFAIEESAGSVQDAYAQRFAELIEQKSGGEIDVVVYPYGALGTSEHLTEQLYNQTIQFVMASPGNFGTTIPELQVFLLNFVLSGDEEVDNRALADPELRGTFDRIYREKGFRLLTFFTEGEMVWTTNKQITEPADFSGVKMRVMTSPLLIAAYQAYGASPTPMSYFEVYSALQLNMIDGQVNPVFAIEEMKFYEVTSVMTFPGESQFVTSAMTSADFYDRLEPRAQRWIDQTVAELQPYILEVQKRFNQERLVKIIEAKKQRNQRMKIVRLTDEQRAPFRAASARVRDLFVADVGASGAAVLQQLTAAIERSQHQAGQK